MCDTDATIARVIRSTPARVAGALAAAALFAACSGKPSPGKGPAADATPDSSPIQIDNKTPLRDPLPMLAARVNGRDIPTSRVVVIAEDQLRSGAVKDRIFAYRQALNQLVVRELLLEEAVSRKIAVDSADVERAYDEARVPYKDDAAWSESLKKQGFTPQSFREELRSKQTVNALLSDEAQRVAEPSDAEVQEYHATNPNALGGGEKLKTAHILLRVPEGAPPQQRVERLARAQEIRRRILAGESFAALAKKHSGDTTSADKGGVLEPFGRGEMMKPYEEAAFALQVGGISDVVRTPFGFHVIKVAGDRPPRTTPIEEVRETLRQELQLERARSEVQKRSADFARAAGGGNLEAVAKSQGLTVQPIGEVREGDALPGLLASQVVVERMLDMAPGQVSDPIPLPSGQVVVQVTGTLPSAPRPFQESRAQILRDFEQERAREAVARTVRSAGSQDGLKAAARILKAELKTQADVTRGSSLAGVPPDPEIGRQISILPAGTLGDPVSTSAGIVVLRVSQRQDHKDEFAAQRDSLGDGLLRQRQDRLYRALVKRLRERGDVLLNEAAIKALDQA